MQDLQTKTANTTALNHCVDCNYLKQSRRLTKSQLEGGGSQILFVAYQINERAQASLHSHSCESLQYRTLLIGFSGPIVTAIDVMSIFLEGFLEGLLKGILGDEKPALPRAGNDSRPDKMT